MCWISETSVCPFSQLARYSNDWKLYFARCEVGHGLHSLQAGVSGLPAQLIHVSTPSSLSRIAKFGFLAQLPSNGPRMYRWIPRLMSALFQISTRLVAVAKCGNTCRLPSLPPAHRGPVGSLSVHPCPNSIEFGLLVCNVYVWRFNALFIFFASPDQIPTNDIENIRLGTHIGR